MVTECNQQSFGFHAVGRRDVVGRFDGGRITTDGGGLLLREAERVTGIVAQFAGCFTDHRARQERNLIRVVRNAG